MADSADTTAERQRVKDLLVPLLLGNRDNDTVSRTIHAIDQGWSLAQIYATFGAPWKPSWP